MEFILYILFLFVLYLIMKTILYKKENFNMSDYIGNNYNYPEKIKTPDDLGVSVVGNIYIIAKNAKAIQHYIKTIGYGNDVLGDKYFIKSGKCNKYTSSKECKDKDRWIFIDNRPSEKKAGLVPGFINDVSYIDPSQVPTILLGSAENQPYKTNCRLMTKKVIKDREYNETRCSVPT